MAAGTDVERRPAPPPVVAASLRTLIDTRAGADAIARFLDDLPPARRVAEVLAITGRGVKQLYEAVAGASELALAELVPETANHTIIYEGRNSLPMFSRFQKRF